MIVPKVTKISEVEQSQLLEFYKKIYFNRHKTLVNNWKWFYRNGYSKYETLNLLLEKKVIGQAGIQPVNLNINGQNILASWFLDFAVLPEYRGKGLGKILTKKLMEQCPNLITFCNDKTLNLVKNLGWKNSSSTYRFVRPINPLKFIPFIKRLNIGDRTIRTYIKKKFNVKNSIKPININDNYEVIKNSFEKRNTKNLKDSFSIIRDQSWLYWRTMECPYKKNLYFFEYKNNFCIVNIFKEKNIKRLNILFYYFVDESCEKELFNLIMHWSISNNIDLVWAIRKDNYDSFSDIFPEKYKKPLIFASWSSKTTIFEILKDEPYNSQAIDSDIDSQMFVD